MTLWFHRLLRLSEHLAPRLPWRLETQNEPRGQSPAGPTFSET